MSEEKIEEKSLYDEAEVSEEIPTDEEYAPDEEVEESWEPQVVKESPKERLERKGLKEKADGRVLTIKEYFFTKPKTKNFSGEPIPPKKSIDGKTEFYSGKLGIRFEEDNLVEYYPSIGYFVNDGKINNTAKINRSEHKPLKKRNLIAQMLVLAVEKMGKPLEEVSDQEFYDWLIGKKAKIETESDVYEGKAWFRNNIVEFVE